MSEDQKIFRNQEVFISEMSDNYMNSVLVFKFGFSSLFGNMEECLISLFVLKISILRFFFRIF